MGVREDEPLALVPPVLAKGKRSKRQRVHAPPVAVPPAPEWSSSAASAAPAAGEEDSSASAASVSAGADDAASSGCVTEEDEDMALCLMLLANGVPAAAGRKPGKDAEVVAKEARFRSRRPADGAAPGGYVYECKTCNKCFPSFQALGGHRTSHKKPRLLLPLPPSEDRTPAAAAEPTAPSPPPLPSPPTTTQAAADETVLAAPVVPAVAPNQEQDTPVAIAAAASSSSKHPRVHECSICGAEFGSGQALGGHMRRHRPLVPAAAPRKEKSLLELDLNMPAPCDEAEAATAALTSPRFAFTAERPPAPLLFPGAAASALVDCHY